MEEFPTVRDHPGYFKPSSVDTLVCPTRQDAPINVPHSVINMVAPKARASVAVFKDTGREWVPEGYDRTPWAVIRAKHRELLMGAYFARNSTVTNYAELTSGTNKTLASNASSGTQFSSLSTSVQTLRWGSGTTAATNADFHLSIETDNFAATSTYDTANAVTYFSGAKPFTSTASVLREVGITQTMQDTSNATFSFLLDRTLTAPLVVNQNRLVAMEYQWGF